MSSKPGNFQITYSSRQARLGMLPLSASQIAAVTAGKGAAGIPAAPRKPRSTGRTVKKLKTT